MHSERFRGAVSGLILRGQCVEGIFGRRDLDAAAERWLQRLDARLDVNFDRTSDTIAEERFLSTTNRSGSGVEAEDFEISGVHLDDLRVRLDFFRLGGLLEGAAVAPPGIERPGEVEQRQDEGSRCVGQQFSD